MADFVQDLQNKITVREPAIPIADVMASNQIVQLVIPDNRLYSREYSGKHHRSGMGGNMTLEV